MFGCMDIVLSLGIIVLAHYVVFHPEFAERRGMAQAVQYLMGSSLSSLMKAALTLQILLVKLTGKVQEDNHLFDHMAVNVDDTSFYK